MSKLCPQCGAPVENEAFICPNCGLNFAPQQPQPNQQYQQPNQQYYQQPNGQYQQPNQQYYQQPNGQYQQQGGQYYQQGGQYYQPQPQQNKPNFQMPDFKKHLQNPNVKKYCIIGGAGLLAIIAIIVAIFLLFPGPETVTKNIMKGIINGDGEAVVKYLLPTNWGYDDDQKDYIVSKIENISDNMDRGDKITYKILRVQDLTKSEIQSLKDYNLSIYENRYEEFNMDDITDYKKVKIKMNLTSDYLDRETITREIILVKYKGQWKLLRIESLIY